MRKRRISYHSQTSLMDIQAAVAAAVAAAAVAVAAEGADSVELVEEGRWGVGG